MSKAFTNEDTQTEVPIVPRSSIGDGPNYLTTDGYAALQRELAGLEADANALNHDRRAHIRAVLASAQVVPAEDSLGDRVVFGSTVRVRDENGSLRTYRLVGLEEASVRDGKINWQSPIGKALLGARVGDVVTCRTPARDEELEIVGIGS